MTCTCAKVELVINDLEGKQQQKGKRGSKHLGETAFEMEAWRDLKMKKRTVSDNQHKKKATRGAVCCRKNKKGQGGERKWWVGREHRRFDNERGTNLYKGLQNKTTSREGEGWEKGNNQLNTN